MAALRRDRELVAVTALCQELAKRGVNIGLSDARPAVLVRVRGMSPLYVTVDASGEFFEWAGAEGRYTVEDPAGAAVQLVEHVKALRAGVGDGS